MGFVAWIIVGLLAGWATGKIMGGSGKGFFMDIILGLIGALVGGFLMSLLGFRAEGGIIYTTLVAIGGAVLLTWIYRKVARPRTA